LIEEREARHDQQMAATAQVKAMETERDQLLAKVIQLEEERQRVMEKYEKEKAELLQQVEAKDNLIEDKVKEIQEKEEKLKAAQPEEIECEADPEIGMSNVLDRAIAESGIVLDSPDITVFEFTEPDIEFIFE